MSNQAPPKPRPPAPPLPDPDRGPLPSRGRLIAFALIVVACLAAGGIYAIRAERAERKAIQDAPKVALLTGADAAELRGKPRLLFRSTALGTDYGKVALAPLSAPDGPRALTPIACDRVAYTAGHGLCLAAEQGAVTTYKAFLFDSGFRTTAELPVSGLPSRARLSPDAKYAVTTVFVSGHSYAGPAFSTETVVWEVATGKRVGNLEQVLVVTKDGERFRKADFNFWGVTFTADDNRFYATLGSGGKTYLIEGNLAGRSARVLRENVECPSLSPDGRRIVFKKRDTGPGPVTWRLHVLDLVTMTETPLAETRTVDDQVEWLDDEYVLYALNDEGGTAATETWRVRADGMGKPELTVRGAFSPAVVTS
jgi:hypothetical protein